MQKRVAAQWEMNQMGQSLPQFCAVWGNRGICAGKWGITNRSLLSGDMTITRMKTFVSAGAAWLPSRGVPCSSGDPVVIVKASVCGSGWMSWSKSRGEPV